MTLISNKKKERNHYFYNKKYQKKDKKIIPIENYICHIYYDNKTAYLSSYSLIETLIFLF